MKIIAKYNLAIDFDGFPHTGAELLKNHYQSKLLQAVQQRSNHMNQTKAEIIDEIMNKVKRAKPIIRDDLRTVLKRQNKNRLQRILKNVKVDRDGCGIYIGN